MSGEHQVRGQHQVRASAQKSKRSRYSAVCVGRCVLIFGRGGSDWTLVLSCCLRVTSTYVTYALIDALMIIIGKPVGWTRVRRCASPSPTHELPSTRTRAHRSAHTARPSCTSQVRVPALPRRHRPPASFHARAFPARTVTHARDTPSRHTRPTAAQTGGTLGRDSRAGGDRLGARGSAQAGAYKHSALSYRPKHQCYNCVRCLKEVSNFRKLNERGR